MHIPSRRQAPTGKSVGLLKALLVLAFVGLGQGASHAQYVPCQSARNTNSEALDRKHELSGIRVFYTTIGANALATTTDLNSNGVPDYVENIAIQLDVSRKLFNSLA